ncbi:MAG: T9SS type A sorting domain-containing protein [Chlorobi bacterium]|nr:T9SS type A sorting domain-containing protein [Chlorobiota bacterium]MCI0717020.1 T9SS type A sorting domain-containing protein [Chlorobiota bacterium]
MKHFFYILIFNYSLLITNYSQWVVVSTQGNQAVNFPSNNTGYSTANGITRKTTNGGFNWSSLSGGNLTGIFFINDLTGWVVGYPGYIGKTTNGSSFTQQPTGIQDRLNDVFFINDNTGWIAGGDFGTEIMFKTTNSGTNWLPISSGLPNKMFSIYFIDENTGWCVGGPSAPKVIKSTNGGLNWVLQSTPATTPLYSVHFADANTGWAVAGYLGGETIINTTNGGANWVSQTSNDNRYLRECFALNANTAFAVGQGGKLIKTTNGGANWLVHQTGSSVELWAIDFVNDTVGYAVGSTVVLKTTNGGVTFINNISNEIPGEFELYQNYPNPFNAMTIIKFELPVGAARRVALTVFDMNGNEITVLLNKTLSAGEYDILFNASDLATGVYFYSLTVGNTVITSRKMILIK